MAGRLRAAWDHTPLPPETMGGIAGAVVVQVARPLRLPARTRRIGRVVVCGGLALVIAAVRERDPGSLEDPGALVTRGLHCRSRNPMYLGFSMVQVGLAGATRSAWMFAAFPVSAGLLHRSILREERVSLVVRRRLRRLHARVPATGSGCCRRATSRGTDRPVSWPARSARARSRRAGTVRSRHRAGSASWRRRTCGAVRSQGRWRRCAASERGHGGGSTIATSGPPRRCRGQGLVRLSTTSARSVAQPSTDLLAVPRRRSRAVASADRAKVVSSSCHADARTPEAATNLPQMGLAAEPPPGETVEDLATSLGRRPRFVEVNHDDQVHAGRRGRDHSSLRGLAAALPRRR